MSKRLTIIQVFKQVAEAGFPQVVFQSGSPGNLAAIELNRNEIYLALGDFAFKRSEVEAPTIQASNFSYYLGLPDDTESGNIEEENIMATAEIMNEKYLKDVEREGLNFGFGIENISETPVYKRSGESLSGLLITATLTISTIGVNSFDIGKQVYLSRNISPYDWPDTELNGNAIRNR